MPAIVPHHDKLSRIAELLNNEQPSSEVCQEINRIASELNALGMSDDYIERCLDAIQVSQRVDARLKEISNPQ